MTRALAAALALGWLAVAPAAAAEAPSFTIDAVPAVANRVAPKMGDRLGVHARIRNTGAAATGRVLAWIVLLETDSGQETPIDLEDWSAQKLVAQSGLAAGAEITVDWSLRLIQAGHYRLLVEAMADGAPVAVAAPLDFTVAEKAVVESNRVLPVSLGLPLALGGLLVWRSRRPRAVDR